MLFGATNISQLRRILKGIDISLTSELKEQIKKIHKSFPLTF